MLEDKEVDQLWAGSLRKGDIEQALIVCARDNNVPRLKYIFENKALFNLTTANVQRAIKTAVESKSVDAIRYMYQSSTSFGGEFLSNWEKIFGIFSASSSTKSEEVWNAVHLGNAMLPTSKQITLEGQIDRVVEDNFLPGLRILLVTPEKESAPLFEYLLKKISLPPKADMLEAVLQWKDRFPSSKTALNDFFIRIARANCLQEIKTFIESGFDFKPAAAAVLPELYKKDTQSATAAYLDSFFDYSYKKAYEKAEENKRFSLIDGDCLQEAKNFTYAGTTLTMVFNFTTRQQIITQKYDKNITMQVISFSELDPETVKFAAEKFLEIGGRDEKVENLLPMKKSPSRHLPKNP